MTRWWKAALFLLVAGATVSAAGLLASRGTLAVEPYSQQPARAATGSIPASGMPVAQVKSGKFKIADVERGSLATMRAEDIYNRVEGQTNILSMLPEESSVKKGDLVCELDSSLLRMQLTNQKISTQSAEAAYQNARLAREEAEIAVKEYEEGIYPSEQRTILGETRLGESEVEKGKVRL